MLIDAGFRIEMDLETPTPMVLMLSVHPSQRAQLLTQDRLRIAPMMIARSYRDVFGNICHRLNAPAGRLELKAAFQVESDGRPDRQNPAARQQGVHELPDEVLQFLLPSRYCDTEALMALAWERFGALPEGWARVQAVTDYVHERIAFGYAHASATRTASEANAGQMGVCRDYAHLAVALCRCLNIPARYATGYLGDIGVPESPLPMDFSAWFQVWLSGEWWDFDARHNVPRIGRILVAAGRDAADVAMITAFGAHGLRHFEVVTREVVEPALASAG